MKKEILAVIPARGGSKGIPRKNLYPLAGKPLIIYSIDAARKSKYISRIIVTTDDDDIRRVSIEAGAEVPYIRPSELSSDNVHAIATVIHALEWLEREESYLPDIVVMLLPTSPLRSAKNIDEAVRLFWKSKAPSVISVNKSTKCLPHLRYIHNGILEPVIKLENPNVQRQDCRDLYEGNGSIYVSTPEIIRKHGTYHTPGAVGYIMERQNSIDINDYDDIKYSEFLLKERI